LAAQMKHGSASIKDLTLKYGAGCYKTTDAAGQEYYFDLSCKGVAKGQYASFKYQKGGKTPGNCSTVHTSFQPSACTCMEDQKATTNTPTPASVDAIAATVSLTGITKADFDQKAQDNFKDVVAAGAGKICGTDGASACTKSDVTISILSRRAALKVSITIKTKSQATATTGASTLSTFLTGNSFKTNLVAKGGALAKVTATSVDKKPVATQVAVSGASTALPTAAVALATTAALLFAF